MCLTLCWLAYLHPANSLSIALCWATVSQRRCFSCAVLSTQDDDDWLHYTLRFIKGRGIIHNSGKTHLILIIFVLLSAGRTFYTYMKNMFIWPKWCTYTLVPTLWKWNITFHTFIMHS